MSCMRIQDGQQKKAKEYLPDHDNYNGNAINASNHSNAAMLLENKRLIPHYLKPYSFVYIIGNSRQYSVNYCYSRSFDRAFCKEECYYNQNNGYINAISQ